MAVSKRLRMRDVRSVFRLVGECCELGSDPIAWREHLTAQLPALLGGQVGIYGEFLVEGQPFQDPFWLRPVAFLEYGWPTTSDRLPFQEHLKSGRPEDAPHVTPDLLERRFKTFHWSGNLGRHGWHQSLLFNEYVKKCHLDDGLFAHYSPAPRRMRWLLVNRELNDRPFTGRDRRVFSRLNLELARLPDTKLAPMGGASIRDLPRRHRDVLVCLMEGDGEKQVALRLGISRHTVHNYVKQLHARFSVSSRGELLSTCRKLWPACAGPEENGVHWNVGSPEAW